MYPQFQKLKNTRFVSNEQLTKKLRNCFFWPSKMEGRLIHGIDLHTGKYSKFASLFGHIVRKKMCKNISIVFTAVFLADLKCRFFVLFLIENKDILKLSFHQLNAHEIYFPSLFSDYYSCLVILKSNASFSIYTFCNGLEHQYREQGLIVKHFFQTTYSHSSHCTR